MGNGFGRITDCLSDADSPRRRRRLRHHDLAVVVSEPCCYDEGLGHSFCYVRPEPSRLSSSKVHHHDHEESALAGAPLAAATITPTTTATSTTTTTTFKSISGASVSANTSTTPLSSSSTTLSPYLLLSDLSVAPAAAFDCSDSFSSVPLQPIPRFMSGPLSGPVERGFLSGPIERGFIRGSAGDGAEELRRRVLPEVRRRRGVGPGRVGGGRGCGRGGRGGRGAAVA